MIVLDATAIANLVGDDGPDGRAVRDVVADEGEASLPDLVDVETVSILRKRWLAGALSDDRFAAAVADLGALPFRRYPALPFMRRAYDLRAALPPHETAYIALAEALGCDLVTADARFAQAAGAYCGVRVLRPAS